MFSSLFHCLFRLLSFNSLGDDHCTCERCRFAYKVSVLYCYALQATATCVWDDSSHSCRVLRVADCSAANLTVDEKVTCRISNVMTINQDRNMSQVAQSLCSGELDRTYTCA